MIGLKWAGLTPTKRVGVDLRSTRIVMRWLAVLLLAVLSVGIMAQEDKTAADLSEMAALLPPADLFAVAQADTATIAQVDALLLQITGELPDEITNPLTLSEVINEALVPGSGLNVTNIIDNLLGDTIAVSVDLLDALDDGALTEDDDVILHAVAPIVDPTLVEGALRLAGVLNDAEQSTDGVYTIYTFADAERVLAIGPELAYLTQGSLIPPLNPETTLAEMSDFNETIETLADTTAQALFYGGSGQLLRELEADAAVQEIFAALGFEIQALGPVAATLQLDGAILVDIVQKRTPAAASLPLDPAFAGVIPAESEIFVHTTDINRLLNTLSGLVASISGSTTQSDIYAQFENLVNILLGLDLQTEVLPWASGNYGVFAQVSNLTAADEPLQVGAVLEITDLDGAQTLVAAVGEAIERLLDNVTVTESRIIAAGNGGTSIDAVIVGFEDATLGPVEIAIGVYESLLFVATYDMAVNLLDGGATIDSVTGYQAVQPYILPETGLALYVADRAPGALIGLSFELLDPLRAIFGQEATGIIVETAPEFFTDLVSSSAVSAVSAENGDLLVRSVLLLEDN